MGNLLQEIYGNFEIRQEYPVNKVNESFNSGREKFDWVVLGLKIVIEIHGQQHYEPVCFGGMLMSEAKKIFEKRVEVDLEKKKAAEASGWAYVVIKYDEKNIDSDSIHAKITEAINNITKPELEIEPAKPKQKIQSRGFQKPPEGYKYKWPKKSK